MEPDSYASDEHRHLHAALLVANTRKAKAKLYLDFFRKPGTADTDVILHEAGAAISLIQSPRRQSRKDVGPSFEASAELYAWRALLRLRARGRYQEALEDIRAACRLCESDTRCGAADALCLMAPRFEWAGQPGEAAMLYEAVVRAWDAAYMAAKAVTAQHAGRKGSTSSKPVKMTDAEIAGRLRAAEIVYRRGECLMVVGDLNAALQAYGNAVERAELLHQSDLAALALAGIAGVHAERGSADEAQNYLLQSTARIAVCEDRGAMTEGLAAARELLARVHIVMCERARLDGSPDLAREAVFAAQQLYHRLRDDAGRARLHMLSGRLLELEARLDDANDEYAQAHTLLEGLLQEPQYGSGMPDRIALDALWADLLLAFGGWLGKHGHRNRARFLLGEAEEIARALHDRRRIRESCLRLAETYVAMGQFAEAYRYQGRAHALATELADESYQRVLAERQAAIDREEAERNKHLLEEARTRAAQARQELKAVSLRLSELMNLVRKVEKTLSAFIADHDSGNKVSANKALEEVQMRLKKALTSSQNHWYMLLRRLHDVDGDYINHLRTKHPELAPAELEVAALICLDLSAQLIAEARGCTRAVIFKHRENMARKLKLKSIRMLNDYLRSICTRRT